MRFELWIKWKLHVYLFHNTMLHFSKVSDYGHQNPNKSAKKSRRQRDTQCTSNAHKPFPAFPCLLSSPNLSTLALELLCQCMESTSEPLTRAALNQKSVAGRGASQHEGHRHPRDAIFIHPEHTSVTSRRILPVSDWDRLHAIIKTAWIKT